MLEKLSPTVRGFLAGLLVMALLWVGISAFRDTTDAVDETVSSTIATTTTTDGAASTTTTAAETTDPAAIAPSVQFSNLPTISPAELPLEALDTLDLIASGGPYPFSQDDGIFQNREGILPDQDRGYYREYTVITPSSDDRGARRIVAGEAGDLYFTADHYDSFKEIVW